jgi:telomerase protein component 1
VYKFKSEEALVPQREKFLPPEIDANVQAPLAPVGEIVQLKTTVINAVATSLLCSPDFKSPSDPTRQNLTKLGEQLSTCDPEFVLKVALYTRNDLNIRTTANFLLALASNLQTCRPFLRKYYCASIRLPSDWIEVAEVYQTFHDKSLNFGALPTALRKVMASKFVEFDVYQLGKYNKDKSKKKKKVEKKKKEKGEEGGETKDDSVVPLQRSDTSTTVESELSVTVPSDTETEEEVERLSFTLKQLIRKIHIWEPVEPVMCLLGKKYPEDPETFRRSRLPGTWEEERAGKRMKLATPETWETTVSLHGNKASTWEQLIDHNKLPFMAMLRNLRNLVIANVSQSHHRWVLGKLNDERAVVNSRQFPFRFFSAYEVLTELEKIADGEIPPKYKPRKGKKPPKPPPKVDRELLKRYRSGLDNALKIATSYNVKPISGSTLILCNVGSNMNRSCTSARGLGKPRTVQEVGILLGLMCKYACEQCTLIVYGESNHAQVELKEGTILHNMEHVQQVAMEQKLTDSDGVIPTKILYNMLVSRSPVDNIVLLTDAMKLDDSQGREMMDFLQKYRHMVNPDLLFVSVDLGGRASGISGTIRPEHKNDVYLAGYSDQILRFIAERGDSGQLTYVDNIDKAYNLKELPKSALLSKGAASSRTPTTSLSAEKALLASTQRQKWRTVRVFISSTFRDMHGERDLLTRFVFPELRARAHSRQIQLYEVDLRWGVTEEDTRHHRALEICLNEISRSNYFLGLLGERYGWILNDEVIGKVSDFEWLKDDGVGHSITEVEMKHACLRDPDTANGKAFFYFRDPSVNLSIPEKHRAHFESESGEAREKIQRLKSEIRTSGLEVYDGYPSKWLGVLEDKPMVGGLEDFGQRVLHNVWNAIKRDFPDDETGLDPVAEATATHNAFAENHAGSFVGRRSLLSKAEEMVEEEEGGVLVMEGKPGSGKSAFMAALAQQCSIRSSFVVLTHFLGAAPSSTNISSILTRLCHETKRRFNLGRDVPEEYPELVNTWTDFLEDGRSAAGGSKLLLFIDGLDLLEEKHNARGMDWLPGRLPAGVVIVVSTVEKGEISTNLKKRNPPPTSLTVGRMNEWDKADMVRENLVRHRKSLDESPFNNQMKLLLSKKDAANPLFLHLACEELRMFGVFEEVSSFLKSLPPTLPHLLQEVLGRIEGELGQELVSVSLSLLCLVRNGLRECELSGLASLHFMSKTTRSEGEASVPAMTLSRLLRCLQGFLQPTSEETSDLLSLAHKDIETAVKLRYMKGRGEKEREFHRLLATYFKTECDPTGEQTYAGSNVRAFNELPHHLMCSEQWKELEEIVCDINFLIAKCQLGSAQNLLEDYTPSMEGVPAGKVREIATYVSQPRVEIFRSFVSRNLHVLTLTPALALQQAINESSSSLIATEAERVLLDNPQPLVRRLNRSPGENPCRLTIPSSSEVTCVAVSVDSKQFAAGFRNCSVRVFNTATGAEIQSFVGHAAEITSLCFVGSHALCSGSHDTNLSLWDLKGGFRIASLTSHTRSVRGCAADAAGKVLVSVSWDTNIRVWDGRTGKQTCFLNTKGGRNCPLNCVSFHPSSDQLVAVGSWDTTVKIWDVFNRKRVRVLKGHQTSVQACAYAPSGRHIVSAALDGEVRVWSTKSGSAVGSITGHCDPVNAISYTPNGQYLLTASSDQLVKVWSGSLGQRVANVGKSEYGYAHCVVHSRQNQTVLVGYHDGHVRRFNTQTEVEEFAVRLHDKAVVAVGAQGRFNMSASADGTIKIWEGPSSLPRHLLLEGHKAGITCAVWTKYGLASAAEDFSLFFWPHELTHYTRMWNQNKSSTKLSVYPLISLKGHTSTISALSFSGDGLKMASASRDRTVIVWDLITMKEARTMRDCHKDWITAVSFPDAGSDTLITGSNDFNLKLWNVTTGEERITFRGHTSAINSVSFSRGFVVSAAFDGSVKVWTRKGVEITTLHCHQKRVNACVLDVPHTTDNSSWADIVEQEEEAKEQKSKLGDVLVVTASDDGTVGVWRPFVPNEVTALIGHSDRVLAVSSTFNNEIISSSRDKTIRIWSPKLPEKMGGVSVTSSAHGHVGEVTSVTASMPYIATGGRDGQVFIWTTTRNDENNKRSLNLKKLYFIKSSDAAVTSLACIGSNNGIVKLAVGRDDGSIAKYEFSDTTFPVETGVMGPATLMGAHPVSDLAVAHGGKCLVAGSWSEVVAAVRTEGGKVAGKMEDHSGWVMGVTVVEEGGEYFALSIGLDRLLCKWPLSESRKKMPSSAAVQYRIPSLREEGKNEAWLLCICPVNSTHIAIGDSGGRVWFWNQVTKKVDFSKKIHRCAINGVAAVGVTLATGSADGSIKIWRVSRRTKDIVQVGHFHAQSSVTSLKAYAMGRKGEGQLIMLTAGDQLGHVMLLEYSATD